MMERLTQTPFNARIHQQACEWFVEFRTGEPEESVRKAFHAWLQESPQHIGAYLQVTALWNESAVIDPDERWSFDTLIAQAATKSGNVVPFEPHSQSLSSYA